jgi:anti-sigma B factor antagonist
MSMSSHNRMKLTISDGVAFLYIQGEVDLANAEHLQALGEDAISGSVHTIRIDLSQVTFLDSTGIAALIAIRNSADKTRRLLVLEQPSPRVMKVLEVTGTVQVFTIEHDPHPGVTSISDKQAHRLA